MVRLPSKLRGRFETTKNPVVRCGTLVLGRPGDGIFTYSAGRRLESENNPGKDQTGNRCTLVFARQKTRNKQNECTTQCVHGRGPACVIAWKMVLRNTGVRRQLLHSVSLDTSLFERRRPARQRRNSRSPEPRVPAARQGRTCARNAFGGCPCVCSLVCGRAYAHPNVSAKLPSKGKRVRYLGLARARMTRPVCAYAFVHEMHAHSHRPSHRRGSHEHVASTWAKADGQHVAGRMSALELCLSRHTPLAYTQRIYGK